jgi:hypothetical protein
MSRIIPPLTLFDEIVTVNFATTPFKINYIYKALPLVQLSCVEIKALYINFTIFYN